MFLLVSVGCTIPLPTISVGGGVQVSRNGHRVPLLGARSHGRITNYTDVCLEIIVDGRVVEGESPTYGVAPGLLPPGETFSIPLFYTGSNEKIVTVRGVACEADPRYRHLVGLATHSFRIPNGNSSRDQFWKVDRLQKLTEY